MKLKIEKQWKKIRQKTGSLKRLTKFINFYQDKEKTREDRDYQGFTTDPEDIKIIREYNKQLFIH